MEHINPLGMFDEHFLLQKLTKLNDPLVKLEAHIDWNIFEPLLDIVFNKPQKSSHTGRPPFDRILMFKLLILQGADFSNIFSYGAAGLSGISKGVSPE